MNPINFWRKFKRVLMLTWRRNNSSFQGKLSNSPTLVENWTLPHALVRVPEHHFFVVKRATTKDAESWCRKLGTSLAVLGVANSAMLQQFLETIGRVSFSGQDKNVCPSVTGALSDREHGLFDATIGGKIVATWSSNGVTSQSTPLPSPLHSKLGCR